MECPQNESTIRKQGDITKSENELLRKVKKEKLWVYGNHLNVINKCLC